MIQAIVFLPLIGAILAGLIASSARMRATRAATRSSIMTTAMVPMPHAAAHDDHGHDDHGHDDHHVTEPPAAGSRAAELITTGLADGVGRPVLGGAGRCRLHAPRRADRAVPLDQFGRPAGRLVAAGRYADRGDAGGGQHRVVARASLFHRLHGRGSVPAALLRLSVAVHLRDADAGDRGQSGAAVLRLGRRRSRELSADRLLVSEAVGERGGDQGLRGQPRRRFRLCARHFRDLHADRLDRFRDHLRAVRRA